MTAVSRDKFISLESNTWQDRLEKRAIDPFTIEQILAGIKTPPLTQLAVISIPNRYQRICLPAHAAFVDSFFILALAR